MARRKISPFGVHLGFQVVEMAEGRATVAFDVVEAHTNTLGIVHGGVTSSIIDHASGAAIISLGPTGGLYALTTKLEVEFLSPIKRGRVECVAEVKEERDDLVIVTATVRSDGRERARGRVEFLRREYQVRD